MDTGTREPTLNEAVERRAALLIVAYGNDWVN
jgi:hypothetical protein